MHRATLTIGTRGSPLALAQAREAQDRLAAALGFDRGPAAAQHHQDHRRRDPGSAAIGGRRQGAVHQRARSRARRGHDRSRGALREGPADIPAGRPRHRRIPAARGRPRRLYQRPGDEHRGAAARRELRLRLAAAPGDGQAAAAGPRAHAFARQRRHAAGESRARRSRGDAARRRRAEAARAWRPNHDDPRAARLPSGRRPGCDRARDARRRRRDARGGGEDRRRHHRSRSSPPNAPSSPCSTAPAARRSPGMPRSRAGASPSEGLVLRPDGSACIEV